MNVLDGAVALLAVVVALNLVLTIGIIRTLRSRSTGHARAVSRVATPRPGFRLNLTPGKLIWPESMRQMTSGSAILVMAVPGCMGCDIVRREIAELETLPARLYVITDIMGGSPIECDQYLRDKWSVADSTFTSPVPLSQVEGLGLPDEFPTLLYLRDGEVIASAHRLTHLFESMPRISPVARSSQR